MIGVLVVGGVVWLAADIRLGPPSRRRQRNVPVVPTLPAPAPQAAADSGVSSRSRRHRRTAISPSNHDNSQFISEATPTAECDECSDSCGLPICSPPGRIWLRADYLMWWTNGTKLPPLVTTSPAGTPVAQAGVLPAATILYGNQTIGNDGRGGVRTTMGMWLDYCHVWNVEFDYFMLGERSFIRRASRPAIRFSPALSSTSTPMPKQANW